MPRLSQGRTDESDPVAHLAAVCDIIASKSEAIGKQFNFRRDTDMDDMMRREALEAQGESAPVLTDLDIRNCHSPANHSNPLSWIGR